MIVYDSFYSLLPVYSQELCSASVIGLKLWDFFLLPICIESNMQCFEKQLELKNWWHLSHAIALFCYVCVLEGFLLSVNFELFYWVGSCPFFMFYVKF